ncbi:hypothetical protein G9A89_018520 [Geosiphon pyriformis]|nr:hypothetical protein G9A89_018520 [Geosiphon pyriformis]
MPGLLFNNDSQLQRNFSQIQTVITVLLPPEIIRVILVLLKDDKKTLAACARVNHTFNLHATPILYNTITFTFPHTFTQFANVINEVTHRSRLIRHLDLSTFSTLGLQKSQVEIQNVVTPQNLISILQSCPMLEAFSVSESLESTITVEVLKTLLFECKNLKALDFCGCSNKDFVRAMNEFAVAVLGRVEILQYQTVTDEEFQYNFKKFTPLFPNIKRLSLHECPMLSEHSTILSLLAHMPNLTHLDLGGCSISDLTLQFLTTETNTTLTLTHLSIAKCKNVSSDAIAQFISQCVRLEHLNLGGEAMAISEWDLVTIVSSPSAKNLRFLDIGSSHITQRVLYAIQKNCSVSLKNLGLGKADLTAMTNISTFLTSMQQLNYVDLTNIPCLNQLNTNILISKIQKDPNHQLHTIEMDQSLLKKLHAIPGWNIDQNQGRRWYYGRKKAQSGNIRSDRVHGRKLDLMDCGKDGMSKIFQYYSYGV